MDKEVAFKCSCGKEFSVKEKEFRGYVNWDCPSCRAICTPSSYSRVLIKGCENIRG